MEEPYPKPIALRVESRFDDPTAYEDEPEKAFAIIGLPEGEGICSDIYLSPGTELTIHHRVEDIKWRRPKKRILWLDLIDQLEDTHVVREVRLIPNFPVGGWTTWLFNALPRTEFL